MSDDPIGRRGRRLEALRSRLRFGQFLTVGLVGFGVDTGTVILLTTEAGLFRGASKLIGAEFAIVVMFLLNEHWTFAEAGRAGWRALLTRLAKSNLVRVGGVLVATVVFVGVSGLDRRLPVGGEALWLAMANAVGIAAGFAVNYVAETLFTWRVGSR